MGCGNSLMGFGELRGNFPKQFRKEFVNMFVLIAQHENDDCVEVFERVCVVSSSREVLEKIIEDFKLASGNINIAKIKQRNYPKVYEQENWKILAEKIRNNKSDLDYHTRHRQGIEANHCEKNIEYFRKQLNKIVEEYDGKLSEEFNKVVSENPIPKFLEDLISPIFSIHEVEEVS
jgi:hypothetical protein